MWSEDEVYCLEDLIPIRWFLVVYPQKITKHRSNIPIPAPHMSLHYVQSNKSKNNHNKIERRGKRKQEVMINKKKVLITVQKIFQSIHTKVMKTIFTAANAIKIYVDKIDFQSFCFFFYKFFYIFYSSSHPSAPKMLSFFLFFKFYSI